MCENSAILLISPPQPPPPPSPILYIHPYNYKLPVWAAVRLMKSIAMYTPCKVVGLTVITGDN